MSGQSAGEAPTTPSPGTTTDAPERPSRLLTPMLFVTGRLRMSARLGVIMVILLVPGIVAAWSFTGVISSQIAFAARERAGVEVLAPALTTMASVVGGSSQDLTTLQAAVAAHPELALGDALAKVRTAASGSDLSTAAGRAELASALADLITADGNNSNLILDPDLDSFYVMDAEVVQLPKALLAAASSAALAPNSSEPWSPCRP